MPAPQPVRCERQVHCQSRKRGREKRTNELTLPFKFPYDGPQKCVLWCHMPPANRHVDPGLPRSAPPRALEFSRDLSSARAQASARAALCGRASSFETRNLFPLAPLLDTRFPQRSPIHPLHLPEGASHRTAAGERVWGWGEGRRRGEGGWRGRKGGSGGGGVGREGGGESQGQSICFSSPKQRQFPSANGLNLAVAQSCEDG